MRPVSPGASLDHQTERVAGGLERPQILPRAAVGLLWSLLVPFAISGCWSSHRLPSEEDRRRLSATFEHVCFVRDDGALYCWGSTRGGALGLPPDDTFREVPVLVDPGHAHVAVAAGIATTCAIRASRQLVCWGNNTSGTLGTGDRVTHLEPVSIDERRDWVDVEVGSGFACGLAVGGAMRCWGGPDDGAGYDESSPLPEGVLRRPIVIPGTYSMVSSSWNGTWALALDGSLSWCGNDGAFVPIERVAPVSFVAYGVDARALIDDEGVAWADSVALLGDRGPVEIPLGERVVAADAAYHACMVTESGRVHCLDVRTARALTDTREVRLAAPAVSIAVAWNFACALDVEDHVSCWGLEGEGPVPYSRTPSRLSFD